MMILWQDLKYGFRMLTRSPGFAVTVVLILTLGIGASTAIFSVVNAVLLRPLPFHEPDRLVQISTRVEDPEILRMMEQMARATGMTGAGNTPFEFHEIQQRNHVFEAMAAIGPWSGVDVGGDEPVNVLGVCVSGDFFSCLGIQTLLGREFRPEEDRPGNDRVVILSYPYWQHRYGGDPDIIGKDIALKDGAYTVVGVLRPEFRFLEYGGMTEFFSWMAQQGPRRRGRTSCLHSAPLSSRV